MKKLKFLGRGSGYHKSEDNTSAYFKVDNKLFLIDCGETVFKKILKLDLIEGIKEVNIFITHMHSDHVGSLGGLIGFCYWKYKIRANIYFKDSENIRNFLNMLGMKDGEDFKVYSSDNISFGNGSVIVKRIGTSHTRNIEAYSYLFKFKEGNDIFYSGDSFETNIDIIRFLKEGNIIYHDTCLGESSVHTSLIELSKRVPIEYRNRVYCMHIDGENFIEEAEKLGFNIVSVT